MIVGFGGAIFLGIAGAARRMLGSVSVFWLTIVVADFFYDGGFAVIGPYMAEVWPTRLRATGMGSAYGFGGIGKIIGPLGLALIVGSDNMITPKATLDAIGPSFLYFAAWMVLCGCAFLFFGFETGGESMATIDRSLETNREPGAGRRVRPRFATRRKCGIVPRKNHNSGVQCMPDIHPQILKARALQPLLTEHGAEINRIRKLTPAVVTALKEGDFFRMLQPKSIGGLELKPSDFSQVTEAIATADGSTGWVTCQSNGCSMTAAYLDPRSRRRCLGRSMASWPGARRAGHSRRSRSRAAIASPARGASPPDRRTPPGLVRICA